MVVMNLPNVVNSRADQGRLPDLALGDTLARWKCWLGMRSRSWWSPGSAGPQPACLAVPPPRLG